MDEIELESSPVFDFTTGSPTTGAAVDADSTPTCDVFENTTNTPILTPACVSRSLTGQYYVQIACTTANGFEEGNSYNAVLSATVEGVAAKHVLATFRITPPIPRGAVVADGSNTASTFKTDRTEATSDFWKDSLLLFITGSLAGQLRRITSYDGSTKFVTLASAVTAAPSASDKFLFINR